MIRDLYAQGLSNITGFDRKTASWETRMRLAGFPAKKRLEDFNFEFQPSIDKAVITDLALLRFIYNAENVVFLGPPGVGKSHLAVAIGIEAVQAGLSVYFANAGILIERLKKATREGFKLFISHPCEYRCLKAHSHIRVFDGRFDPQHFRGFKKPVKFFLFHYSTI